MRAFCSNMVPTGESVLAVNEINYEWEEADEKSMIEVICDAT